MLLFDYSNWPTMEGNLQKVSNIWGRISDLLLQERDDYKIYGIFYVVVVQYVFIFGEYMWVVMPQILKELGSLHN